MMKKHMGRAAVAALAGIVAAGTATAGPLNPLSGRSTTSSNTSVTNEVFNKSLQAGGTITKTITSTVSSTVLSTVAETFTASFVPSYAVSVTGSDLNYTSPHHNDGATGGIAQTISVTNSAGITQAQATAGNANVTVASNALYSGSALTGVVGTVSATTGIGGTAAALALLPGFALQNSNAVAIDLMVAQFAAAQGAAPGGYLEIAQNGVSEYSPHHNEGVTGDIAQSVTTANSAGITQIQAQAGNANVQAAHNIVLYSTSFNGTVSQ